ncbi:MAG: response regulator [Isosphaeraceae bacterium]
MAARFTSRRGLISPRWRRGPRTASFPGVPEGVRVLLAIPHEATRRSTLVSLARLGVSAVAVEDGLAALSALREAARRGEAFSTLIADSRCPGIDGYELASVVGQERGLTRGVILVLWATDRGEALERCRKAGAGHLTRPLKESDLATAIIEANGPRSVVGARPRSPAVSTREATGATRRPLRVLLVDDHSFNLKVGTHKLKRWGHEVVTAGGGIEALELLANDRFDVALIDVQMADMDGLEVAAELRRREAETGDPRLPVIAVTARAMKGDRETCLAAGMDGYVTKPVRDDELWTAVRLAVPWAFENVEDAPDETPAPTETAPGANAPPPSDVDEIDPSAVLDRAGGNAQLALELLAMFGIDQPRLLTEIEDAVARGDAPLLDRAAHSLKGMLRFFGLTIAAEHAAALEALGRSGDLGSTSELVASLSAELRLATPRLATLGRRLAS